MYKRPGWLTRTSESAWHLCINWKKYVVRSFLWIEVVNKISLLLVVTQIDSLKFVLKLEPKVRTQWNDITITIVERGLRILQVMFYQARSICFPGSLQAKIWFTTSHFSPDSDRKSNLAETWFRKMDACILSSCIS